MSVTCGLECAVCLGCARWAWRRCTYVGDYDSATWPPASAVDFSPVPRLSLTVLSAYDEPPIPLPPSDLDLLRRASYSSTLGRCPPYAILADRAHRELIVAIRGLNLIKESDYKILLDNDLGQQMFDGGYVHHGLLKAATWLLDEEGDRLTDWLEEFGEDWKLVFVGHSLGSGVAALATVLAVNHLDRLGGISRDRIRGYALAPARCMSLNLAVKYADVINSVVLQDDFLPRTATPLEYIFGSVFCLPCLLFMICLRDTFIPEGRKLRDPRRLYAPGRMYHVVERKFCRCGRFPPEVRSAIPVEGRFEHIVLSCNATSDHGIIWIEREARKALQRMKEETEATSAPTIQKMERLQTLQMEHKEALDKAFSLEIPHAVAPPDVTPGKENANSSSAKETGGIISGEKKPKGKTNWNELVEKLFDKNETGNLTLKKDAEALK